MRFLPALLLALAPSLWGADGSLQFTRASSQYVEVPAFHNAGVAGEVTVEFWARADATAQQAAFMLDPDDAGNRFQASISYFNGTTYWDCGNRRAQIANPVGTVGVWNHYALVCGDVGNFIGIYLNGNQLATFTGSVSPGFMTAFNPAGSSGPNGYRLRIGGSTGFHFGGGIDEFRVWNVARTGTEIRRDLFRTLAGNEAGLRLYYKFDEGAGIVAANSATATGASFNGTLVNGPAWSAPARTAMTVTNTDDNTAGSLRQALAGATRGTVIGFAPGLSGGTIRLTTGELAIPADRVLAIDASSLPGGITISGDADGSGTPTAGDSTVLKVGTGSTATIESLTITKGRAQNGSLPGGGILNDGTLVVVNSTVSNNQAGDGRPTNDRGGHGGGIFNKGTLVVVNSTISNNRAGDGSDTSGGYGGGIYNDLTCSLAVMNTTVSNNRAGDGFNGKPGGGGGGISNDGNALLVNCTVSENLTGGGTGESTGGGINHTDSGVLTLIHSTVTGNRANIGGGIRHSGSSAITLENTIIAGNFSRFSDAAPMGDGPDLLKSSGTFMLSGVNLIGDNSDVETAFPAGLPNANGDFVGSVGTPLDPRLGPLAANGGRTLTRHPLPGSPAIDLVGAPADSIYDTDQRGFPRVVGGRVDIGAVEVQPAPTLIAPGSATSKKGRVTLRGTSANATKVEYQPGNGAYRSATGLARWTARISRLTKPVTRVIVRATSSDGRAAQRTVVVRQVRKKR